MISHSGGVTDEWQMWRRCHHGHGQSSGSLGRRLLIGESHIRRFRVDLKNKELRAMSMLALRRPINWPSGVWLLVCGMA
jgi:hypothetical protein